MLDIILFVIAFVTLYWEVLWPYVIYPLQARSRGCGSIKINSSWLYGLPRTIRVLKQMPRGRILEMTADQDLKMGKIKTYIQEAFCKYLVVTRDPENLKAILATQFSDFALVKRTTSLAPLFGSGIFTQDGSEWKHSRAMLRPQFSKEQVSRIDGISQHTDVLINKLKQRGGQTTDVQELFHMLTMDTSTEFLFGESVNSLSLNERSSGILVEDPKTHEVVTAADFVESYNYLNQLGVRRVIFNNNVILSELFYRNYRKHMHRAHIIIDHYVRLALDKVQNGECPDDQYVFSYELAKETSDPIVIRDNIFNILIAGRDTTASALSYSFYYLAKYPEIWQKVREDVWAAFPAGTDTEFTFDGLRRLQYVPHFIKEVLRLSPAVPLNMRTAVRDTTLPRGGGSDYSKPVFLPKGTTVFYAPYVMHRDPEIYGPTADQFDPDRWLSKNRIEGSPMNSWGYLPFNGGPRICLGQQFALTELQVVICKLAHAFEEIVPGRGYQHELLERQSLTASVGGSGVPLQLVPAEN